MIQQLLPLLPDEAGTGALIIAITGALIGLGMWLIGARFSRPMVTLAAVTIGAIVGLRLPQWFGWTISGMGPAVGGAIGLGMLGFIGHRFWIGVGLGAVMAWWVGLGTWVLLRNGQSWSWPVIDQTTTFTSFCTDLWRALPPQVMKVLPFSCGAAMVSGILAPLLWPRAGVVLTWSLAGVSLLVSMGLAAVKLKEPNWIDAMPAQTWAQAMTFFGLVMFGAILQWRLAPASKAPNNPAPAKSKPEGA
jgi:hypothetical protein